MPQQTRLRRLVGLGSRFLTIGALSTLIEIAAFNVLFYAFGLEDGWAKAIASLIALVNAYFGNREWTFKDRGAHSRAIELVLFVVVNAVCTVLGVLILDLGLLLVPDAGPVVVNAVNLVSIAIVVLVRFVLYHYVVFRGVRPSRTAGE